MRIYLILAVVFFQPLFVSGQLPVSKEPMHHNVFENAFVRVLDVHLRPGDTSLFHKHETPSVFIVLDAAKTGSEVTMEEAKATALANDASISFEGFYTKPRVHRVWNEDTSEFHVMDIEILNKQPHNIEAPLEKKGLRLLFDEKPVRTYRLSLNQGSISISPGKTPFLVIGLTNSTNDVSVNKKSFSKKGAFLFVPAGRSIQFQSKSLEPFSFAVLEFK